MQAWLLVLHIIAVAAWLGTNIAQFVLFSHFRKASGPARAALHRAVAGFGRRLYIPAGTTVFVTGILLVLASKDAFRFSDSFVVFGVVAIVIGAVLGPVFFAPRGRRAAELFEQGSSDAINAENQIRTMGIFDTTIVVVAIIAMVQKWGI